MIAIIDEAPTVDARLKPTDVLWRYLDAAKFFALVEFQRLHLCRGDRFEDKFEGAFTKSIKEAIEKSYRDTGEVGSFNDFKKRLRERVFISCWHHSGDDSMAMWQLYGKSRSAVAITTTVQLLTESLKARRPGQEIFVRKVEYVKHWRDPKLRITPPSNVFAYKVKAYAYEQEVRVIVDCTGMNQAPESVDLEVSLNSLLRSIVVAPEAPEWFVELIRNAATRYGITTLVRRSKLAFDPENGCSPPALT